MAGRKLIWPRFPPAVLIVLILALQHSSSADQSSLDNLVKESVVPDAIDSKPQASLSVTFDSGVQASQGNELTPTQVKNMPTFKWKSEPNQLYTIVMLDLDSPSRAKPEYRELLHLMVTNIPGGDLSRGHVVSPYVGAGPAMNTGLHRIVFLVYKQPTRLSDKMSLTKQSRFKFRIRKFAQKYKLGQPIAANFYQTKWDLYVPILYAKLSVGR